MTFIIKYIMAFLGMLLMAVIVKVAKGSVDLDLVNFLLLMLLVLYEVEKEVDNK